MTDSSGRLPSGPPRRRAWGTLSRARIVDAALRIARSEGMGALTVRRLAADLDASRMALYRHVSDKDELVALVLDAVAEQGIAPHGVDAGPWDRRLRLLAHGIRRELAAYPGLAEIVTSRTRHGPGALRTVELILEILAEAGLDERQAARYYLVFLDLVLGRVQRELHGDVAGAHRDASLDAADRRPGEHPRLDAAEEHLRALSPDEVFATELDMLVHVIAHAARPG